MTGKPPVAIPVIPAALEVKTGSETFQILFDGDHRLIDAHLNRLTFICVGHIAQTF
jgi:hypothetical protein